MKNLKNLLKKQLHYYCNWSTTIMNIIDPESPKRKRVLPSIIKNLKPEVDYYSKI